MKKDEVYLIIKDAFFYIVVLFALVFILSSCENPNTIWSHVPTINKVK